MSEDIKVDLCIIGAGSGGLSVAAGAAQMGASVVLVEKAKMGGDCLNTGCVPSKALIAAGHVAATARDGATFGIGAQEPTVDFAKVNAHVNDVIAGIAPHDSVERFEGLGVRVIQAEGRFVAHDTLEAGDVRIRARRFVVATGSRAFVPPIPGLGKVKALTNETIFDLTERPNHLVVIGGGPIGIEMAQAHCRLGCRVTLIEGSRILGRDDPELTDVLRHRLLGEGIVLREGATVTSVAPDGDGVQVTVASGFGMETITGSHLLVAVGRAANVDGLGLDVAGVKYSRRGIEVDNRLRSSNKKILAIGDVAGGYQFTHVAGYHAGIVIRNALFRLPAKADHSAVPWVTYADPELAKVGLIEAQASEQGVPHKVLRAAFKENDRARAERATDGLLKAVVGPRGQVLGACIVGARAGELILPWVLAVQGRLKIKDLASVIAPYPTLSEITKRAAGSWYTPGLFSERTRCIVRFLARFG
jgi:pyruvate/2-oxoglutarate dehydrogenase complex dihydrolipoamide dehydrogenase (E3) component